MTRYACTAAELSCIIGNIFAELSPPCEECGEIPCRECPYYHESYFCGYISEYCDVFGSFENL